MLKKEDLKHHWEKGAVVNQVNDKEHLQKKIKVKVLMENISIQHWKACESIFQNF